MRRWLERASEVATELKNKSEQVLDDFDAAPYKAHLDTAKQHLNRGLDTAKETYAEARDSEAAKQLAQGYNELTSRSKDLSSELRARFQTLSEDHSELSEEEKLKRSIDSLDGKDRVGLLGEGFSAAVGAVGGAAASGAIASAAGATTLFGSSALGSVLGGVFVTATPVGWVIGSALVLGAAGYGAAKLVRSGSEQDNVRAELIEKLTERLNTLQSQAPEADDQLVALNQITAVCIAGGLIDEPSLNRMIGLVEEGKLDIAIAIKRLTSKAAAAGLIELTPESQV